MQKASVYLALYENGWIPMQVGAPGIHCVTVAVCREHHQPACQTRATGRCWVSSASRSRAMHQFYESVKAD